jgi:acetyl esterase/lipase
MRGAIAGLVALSGVAGAQEPQVVRLSDTDSVPFMTVYRPAGAQAERTGIVIMPGGAYARLALNHEGRQVANYLNSLGIVAFVLNYRVAPHRHPAPMLDAQRAIRVVRARASEWGVDAGRVGVLGFSAGGHLAATVSTQFDVVDGVSSRPDFAVLAYPVISMSAVWAHGGSRRNLLGADTAEASALSAELRVTGETAPTFLFHTSADPTVAAENSVEYYLALRRAGVRAELHVFERGAHGVGLAMSDPALAEWPRLMGNWLRVNGWIQ